MTKYIAKGKPPNVAEFAAFLSSQKVPVTIESETPAETVISFTMGAQPETTLAAIMAQGILKSVAITRVKDGMSGIEIAAAIGLASAFGFVLVKILRHPRKRRRR